jgi:hypothetical protein
LFEHGVPRGDLPRFWNLPVQAGCPLTVRVGLSGRGQLYAYGPEGHQIAAESGAHCLSLSFIPEDSGVHFLVLTNESGRPCSYSILAG